MSTKTPHVRTKRSRKESGADIAFNIIVGTLIAFIVLVIVYPLYFIVIASISEPSAILNGDVLFLPAGITFEGYAKILSDPGILQGFGNSLLYTGLGTLISVSLILCGGYALSRKDLYGRKVLMMLFVITMFFDGGLVARYLVVKDLGMLNTIWAVVLPGAVGIWNLIIARAFFENNIPAELREASQLDGANDFRFFAQIVLPLSKPLIALMVMIHFVANWNAFFDALIYLDNEEMYPLQLVLRNILIQSEVSSAGGTGAIDSYAAAQRLGELMKYGMIVISSAPLMIALPFMQKYFTQGAMLGAVKS
ncbi:MAG: carbohydrate ABC transporter permease [Actinomycetaceae bacterium]|nr:carbohydrate ABC transporter permease [Actinomycetaceae bacterium]